MAKEFSLEEALGRGIKKPTEFSLEEALGAPAPEEDRDSTIGSELVRGGKQLASSIRTGIGALVSSPEEAARAGVQRSEAIGEEAGEGVSLEAVKRAYREKGLLSAAGEVIDQAPRAVASQAAQLALMAGGAKTGAVLGSGFGPVGTVVGGALGAGATLLPQLFGSNVERQASEQMARNEEVDINRLAAGAGAVGQTALETAAPALILGKRLVKGLLGITDDAALATAKAKQEMLDAANRSLLSATAQGTARGVAVEIPVEIASSIIERAQAGLDITSPDALAEYGEVAYQSALIGGPLGAASGAADTVVARQAVGEQPPEAVAEFEREREEFARQAGPEQELPPGTVPADVEAEAEVEPPVELPGGFTVTRRELSRQDVPEAFGIFPEGGGKPLATVATQEEAALKLESLTQIRQEEQERLRKESEKINNGLLAERRKIEVMEATGQTDTDQYVQAKAALDLKQQEASEKLTDIDSRIESYSTPLTFAPMGTRTEVQNEFIVNRGDEQVGVFPSLEAAESTLREIAPEPFKQAEVEFQTKKIESVLKPAFAKFNLGDVGLNIVEAIKTDDGQSADGSYARNLIQVAMDADKPLQTMRHESMHALKELQFFTPQQWKALTERAEKQWIKEYLEGQTAEVMIDGKPQQVTRLDAYKRMGLSQEDIVEEAIADAFGAYDRGTTPPPGLIAALYKKLKNFFVNFGQALRGAGFESADDIFERIDLGKLKSRKPKAKPETKEDNKLSLPVARKVAKQLKVDADLLKATSIQLQTGKSGANQFKQKSIGGLPKVVKHLEDLRLASGVPVLDINNPQDREQLSSLLAAEAMAAINAGGNALQWYDSVIDTMMRTASLKYPELATSEDSRAAFRIAIAISSQGLNVEDNLLFATSQYDYFRDQQKANGVANGRFKETGSGADGAAMKANFILANEMIRQYGMADLRKFLQTEFRVDELRSAGFDITGELKDEMVTGSAIFGPKIGFGFYSNLSGDFEPVTMDMWFMRTIGRLTGKLKGFDQKKFDNQIKRFINAIKETGDDGIYASDFKEDTVNKALESVEGMVEFARIVNSAFNYDFKNSRELYNEGALKKSELVYAAQSIIQSYDAPKDAPQSGTERRLLRDVVTKTVKKVEDAYGQRIPPASLQALIWYPEQELYKALGVKLRVTSQDYAGAMKKILVKEGFDGTAIDRAAQSGSGALQPVARKPAKKAAAPVGKKSEAAFQPDEREAFLEERRSEQVLKQEREAPRRKKVIFEVAPDPNNTELTSLWRSLPQERRLEISNEIVKDIIAKAKKDLGFDGRVFPQVGSYLDDTNPSFALFLESGDSIEISKFIGYALSQDSMMVVSPRPGAGLEKTGAVVVDVKTQSASEIDAVYQQLRNIRVNGEQIVGGQTTMNNKMIILNYSGVKTEDFAKLVDQELKGDYDVEVTDVYSAFPEKKDYDYASPENDPRGQKKIVRERARSLRGEATKLLEEKTPKYSLSRGQRILDDVEQGPGARSGIVLGKKQAGAISYVGAHYGKAQVQELDATKYGTGLRGAERRRLDDAFDERIKKRVYFYIKKDDGSTPIPESGVGQYVYTQKFDNILPPGPEMSRLFREANGDANNFEANVIDAGYDGYAVPSMGMMVVLNHNTPVDYRGTRAELSESGQKFSLKNVGFPSVKAVKEAVAKTSVPETPEFKRFIAGNQWVDEDGKAAVFYHATADEFLEFTPSGDTQAIYLSRTPEESEVFGRMAEERRREEIYNELLNKDQKLELFQRVLGEQVKKGNVTEEQVREFIRDAKRRAPEYGKFGDFDKPIKDALLDLSPARMSIMPLYARAETPFDFRNPDHVAQVAAATRRPDAKISEVNRETAAQLRAPTEYPDNWYRGLPGNLKQGFTSTIEQEPVQIALRRLGFDGYISRQNRTSPLSYAVYNPTQLKSVTDNSGEFDREVKNISYSLRAPKTPEFKQWFGDSKIVDADGNPLVMYHGTSKDVEDFTRKEKRGTPIFLTSDPRFADRFAIDSVDVATARVEQVLTKEQIAEGRKIAIAAIRKDYRSLPEGKVMIDSIKTEDYSKATPEAKEYLRNAYKEMMPSGPNVLPVYVSAQNPFDYENPSHVQKVVDELNKTTDEYGRKIGDLDKGFLARGGWELIESKRVQDAIIKLGFDGFYVKEDGRKNIAVYESGQVKSALSNVGSYDRSDPRVRYSLPVMPKGVDDRINETTTSREKKNFARRIVEAIAPKSAAHFRAAALNRYNQLSVYDKKRAEQMGGAALLADQSAESAALMSDVAAGVAASAMGFDNRTVGIPVLRNGITTIDSSVKGLIASLAPLAAYGDPKIYQHYQYWAMVKRGKRLNAQGKETGIDATDVAFAKVLEQKYPKDLFVNVQKDLINFNNGLVKYMVDTGVLSKERGAEYVKYADYVPFYRQMEGEGTVGPNLFQSISNVRPPKKLKGADAAEAPLADFLETMVRNTTSAIQAGAKNYAAQRAIDVVTQVKAPGMGATRLAVKSNEPNVINVLEKGEVVSYETADELLLYAVQSLNLSEIPGLSILAMPADALRNLVTRDPGFMMANLLRDSLSSYVTSGQKMTPIVDTVIGFGKALGNMSPTTRALLDAGIISGYDTGNIEESGRNLEADLAKKAGKRTDSLLLRPFKSLWDGLEKGTTASDAATRAVIYDRVLAETGNEAEALYRALEVMNFHRKGGNTLIRILTATIPFFNARLQGLDLFYRASSGNMNNKDAAAIKRKFFMRGTGMMALSVAYYLAVADDEEYKKQEQETKDNNWIIPSLGIRIPIPFEVGVLFKVLPERITALLSGRDTAKDFGDSALRNFTSTFGFNPFPQAIKPLVETYVDYNFFTGRPIISEGLKDVSPEFQVGPGTTSTAEWIAGAFGASPMKVDHIIKGYTGTIGGYALEAIDSVSAQFSDTPKATKRFEQMPIIKRFVSDPEARGSVTEFYKLKDSVDTVVRTLNLLEKTGESEAYIKYLQENKGTFAFKDYVRDTERTMKELRAARVAIRSSSMSGDEKRDALLQISRAESQISSEIQKIKKAIASMQ